MPHLKRLFHCGRQKRDNRSAIKMLHQMSVWVVVVVAAAVVVIVVVGLLLFIVCLGSQTGELRFFFRRA